MFLASNEAMEESSVQSPSRNLTAFYDEKYSGESNSFFAACLILDRVCSSLHRNVGSNEHVDIFPVIFHNGFDSANSVIIVTAIATMIGKTTPKDMKI